MLSFGVIYFATWTLIIATLCRRSAGGAGEGVGGGVNPVRHSLGEA